MNDAAHEPAPSGADDELAALLADLNELGASLGVSRETVLPAEWIELVSYKSGIPVERLYALLDGAKPVPGGVDSDLFVRRLNFLHETRHLDDEGKKLKLDWIVKGTRISKGMVSYLLNGKREPNARHAARLERFFEVDVGFCSLSESEALIKHLRPVVDQLSLLQAAAELFVGQGVTSVAARGAGDLQQDPKRLATILPLLLEAVNQKAETPDS